ncbi:autotransporter outer membrane beta-barrel domain-containing protein [Snodgrassella sp. ESL0324]|uniref:autotransporter outer membrane beta-barrel domain-containing protein n=1 Tax=Snodgrassella sp. ESL0324 TaxID=2705033 RepID=UPI001582E16D|nr:autotransporter outer membrane beta-barrel domain-containing protein [Snodgrassella sp. ESL0324]NUF09430.1 autotransporter outer membrane beta-barrel domain-containing protein [Snodgrassella sp. ESL0324]
MNNIYKSKWSEATQTWVACSELVRGKTKNNCVKIAAAVALAMISISSYAAEAGSSPCTTTTNVPDKPNINVSGSTCYIDDSIKYSTITAKNSTIENNNTNIVAEGSNSAISEKVINITGKSSLTADTITTTNNKKNNQSSALYVNNGSSVTVKHDLNATNTNTGTSAQIISVKNGSALEVTNDITITDEGGASDAGILNDHGTITANNITITGNQNVVKGSSAIINKNGGSITTKGNLTIEQGGKNSAIQQIQEPSDDDEDQSVPPEIHIGKNLDITTYASESNASAIDIQSGTITVEGNTTINMTTNLGNKNPSVINVGGGTYTAKGNTTITIMDKDTDGTKKENTTTTGIILTDGGIFTNEGKIEVNGGKNSVIASDQSVSKDKEVIFNNNGTTSSQVDTVVHNGSGIFTIKNNGTLESVPLPENKDKNYSVIKNKAAGNVIVTNTGTLSGNVSNDSSGQISITNTNTGTLSGDVNNGTLSGDVNNDSSGQIIITNDGSIKEGSINNNATHGYIEITNNGSIKEGSINNNATDGYIEITNNNLIEAGSINSNATGGRIEIINNKDINSSINNNNDNASILIHNNKNSTINGDITIHKDGILTVNNNEASSVISGNIANKDKGVFTIYNFGKVMKRTKTPNKDPNAIDEYREDPNEIENSGTGSMFIINENTGEILSNIKNENTGIIKIFNKDKSTLSGSITNTGDKRSDDAENILINNNHILNSTINNEGNGSIVINNNTASSVINGKSIHTKAADTDTKVGINGDITNKNTGKITLKNSGNIQNKIENSGSGLIDITNDNTGNIASTILNGGAGIIDITNDGTLSGSITNTGDPNTVTANNIDIKNSTSGNIASKILNGGAGNIKITNNGTISGSTTDDELPNSIENTGTGNISLINDGKIASDILNGAAGSGIKITNNNTLSGTITNTNSGSVYATNTGTFTGMTTNSGSGILDLDNKGIWNNTGNSVLTKLQNTTGTIIFPQVSEVNAGDKDQYHTITVNGNYTGGGLMRVNTVWNKDGTSYSDRVDIHGDVDGAATTVQTLNKKGIYGDVTLKEIPIHSAVVVHVAGKSSGNDFTGSAPTTNAGEAQLKKIDTTSGTDYAWTLTAQPKTPDPVVPVPPGPTVSDKPVPPAPPIKEVPIYAEPVSGYVQMPAADMELGFTTVGTLHERRGENQTYNITGSNNTALGDDQQQTWGRVLVKHLDKDGKKRLDTAGNQSVLQIGHDFILDENEKTGIRRHIGGYVAYGHNENDFRDDYRAKNGYIVDDHYTGKGRTDAVSVGGYGTFYGNNGGYVDLVGQVTYLRNKYNARSNESVHQNGWGAALSAETGKSFIVYGNNWFVEPQAQLVYQYLSLDDFNDRIRHVDQHDPSALRGRVGMRFGYNGDTRDNLPSSSFYGIANIWHDFVNPKSVDIGRDSLKEEYAKTWGELGLGIQLPITRQSDFYSDIRYEKNFGSDKRKGFKGTMGYKYTWL